LRNPAECRVFFVQGLRKEQRLLQVEKEFAMRISDTGLYVPTYTTRSKPAQEQLPTTAAGSQTTAQRTLERDQSASGLASNLWQLQTGVYSSKDAAEAAMKRNDLRAEFLEESAKTPAERIRDLYLEEHGLTEEMLAEMPEEDRKAVEEEIAALIKRQYGMEDTTAEEGKTTATGV
jgi:hypothetical protein